MKKVFAVLLVLSALSVKAQVTEINPLAEWKYVRSQEFNLQDRSIYQFEVPVDSAYDYLINLTIKEPNIETFISVTDLQNKPVGNVPADIRREQLEFKVDASGTYKISLIYKGPEDDDGNTAITFNLIRRPTVN